MLQKEVSNRLQATSNWNCTLGGVSSIALDGMKISLIIMLFLMPLSSVFHFSALSRLDRFLIVICYFLVSVE